MIAMKQITKSLLVTLFIILFNLTGMAQSLESLINDADLTFYKEDFESAFTKYNYIRLVNPREKSIDYHREIAYHLTAGRGTDLDFLLSFEGTRGKSDKFYNYWMGRVYFSRYEFQKAKEHFDAFLKVPAYKSDIIVEETRYFLEKSNQAIRFYDDPDYYEITSVGDAVNSDANEMSPAFFGGHNELVFMSDRSPRSDDEPFMLFHAIKTGNDWAEPTPLEEFGTYEANRAKVEIVNEDGKLFVYQPDNGGNLYFSEPTNSGWTTLNEFDTKMKKSMVESHFFINDHEDRIFFSSKKSGQYDIYESFRDPDTREWTEPTLVLGINTSADEDSPYLSHDGERLYFSSNRPESIGGYDIFVSYKLPNTNAWSEPENLGFPINTIDDEMNFEINPGDKTGFFSSNRLHGEGGFDIYSFKEITKLWVKGHVMDEISGAPVDGATIKFHPKTYLDESFTASISSDGSYEVNLIVKEDYKVEIVLDGYAIYDGDFSSITDDFSKPILQDYAISIPAHHPAHPDYAKIYEGEKEEVSSLAMLGSKFRAGQKAVINNIYFNPQSSDILAGSE
jgi:hypothetical protein